MKAFLGAVMLTIFSCTLLRAEPYIPFEQRVPNDERGSCVWCCLEMMSKYHKFNYGLHAKYGGPTNHMDLESILQKEKVPFSQVRPNPSKSLDFLEANIRADVPVMVVLWWWPYTRQSGPPGWHAVIVTGIKDNQIGIIDPNTPGKNWTWSETAFKKYWVGWSLVLKEPPLQVE